MLKLIRIDNARMNVPEPEYFVTSDTIKAGELLRFYDGRVQRITKKEHFPQACSLSPANAGERVAVCLLSPEQIWEVESWYSPEEDVKLEPGVGVWLQNGKINGPGDHAVIVSSNGARLGVDKVQIRFNMKP